MFSFLCQTASLTKCMPPLCHLPISPTLESVPSQKRKESRVRRRMPCWQARYGAARHQTTELPHEWQGGVGWWSFKPAEVAHARSTHRGDRERGGTVVGTKLGVWGADAWRVHMVSVGAGRFGRRPSRSSMARWPDADVGSRRCNCGRGDGGPESRPLWYTHVPRSSKNREQAPGESREPRGRGAVCACVMNAPDWLGPGGMRRRNGAGQPARVRARRLAGSIGVRATPGLFVAHTYPRCCVARNGPAQLAMGIRRRGCYSRPPAHPSSYFPSTTPSHGRRKDSRPHPRCQQH